MRRNSRFLWPRLDGHTHSVMEAERTWITLQPKPELMSEPLTSVGMFFEGEISDEEVAEFLKDLNAEYWSVERNTKRLNWGAASSSIEILIELAQTVASEAFWFAVGVAIDRLWERTKDRRAPDPEITLHRAVQSILLAHPEERHENLDLIGEGEDKDRGTRSATYRSPTHDYTVELRLTPKGYPYVVANRRESRPSAKSSGSSTERVATRGMFSN